MVNYDWFRKFLAEELATAYIELNRRNPEKIAEHIINRLETKRLAVVPTFLDDNMYDAQKSLEPTITYSEANAMYTSALLVFSEYAAQKVKYKLEEQTIF